MSDKNQEYKGEIKRDGSIEIRPVTESESVLGYILYWLGKAIVYIWQHKVLRYTIIAFFASLFIISVIIVSAQYNNPLIHMTDLTITSSSNAKIETREFLNYSEKQPCLLLESYVEDGKTVVAYATFENNQSDRKRLTGSVTFIPEYRSIDKCIFRIYLDGILAYDSGEMGGNYDEQTVDISIDGVSKIRIEAYCTDSAYSGELLRPQMLFRGYLEK